jgi:oligo-1,6-glucosidase
MGAAYGNGASAFLNGPRIHEFLHEMYERVFAGRDALLTVGEMPGVTVDEAILFTDPAREEVDMVFQFDHVWADRGAEPWILYPLKLTTLKAIFGRWQAGLAEVGWNSLYWNNHDQPRAVSRFGDDGKYRVESAKMLGTILHLHRGTPYVYQGEELGMTNFPFHSIEDFRDIEALGQYAQAVTQEGRSPEDVLSVLRARGRDNARTPMQWDASPQAGFTTGTPWLAVNPNPTEINAAAAAADPDSVYHYYRKLIDLRHIEPAVVEGDFTMLLPHDEQLYAFTRRLGSTELLVIGNFSGSPATAAIDDAAAWAAAELVLTNTAPPMDGLTLGPWQAVVYRREVNPLSS